MKIGLIDPALRRIGHHSYFSFYIYTLLKKAGMDVLVADFGNVLVKQSGIPNRDLIQVSDHLPTELFPIKKRNHLARLLQEGRKYRFFKNLGGRLDNGISTWIVATYDPYVLPLLYYSGLREKEIVPIIHYTKYFRRYSRRFYGVRSYWEPRLMLENLLRAKRVLYMTEGHKQALKRYDYRGKSAFIPYNSISEEGIDIDNRRKMASEFRLCTVGLIRTDKDINFVMEAVRDDPGVHYFVGGKIPENMENSSYIRETRRLLSQSSNITARFDYLSLPEYNEHIEQAHYAIVPITDKYERGGQLTGLMVDSLINKRPFIGPDIFPINQYVKNHGVGLLYEMGNLASLKQTIHQAKEIGAESFYDNIISFLRENSIERTAHRLRSLFASAS